MAVTLCKTTYQYNKQPVSQEDMKKLLEIAEDYRKVKSYVYQRYGGIKSLSKIYPGYTVQNEMTESGLRAQLGLPSVYFYLAVFEALGDIKKQWSRTKSRVAGCINQNTNFTPEEKHYLRFVMKQSQCFEAVLTGKEMALAKEWEERYQEAAVGVDTARLNRYLCKQVRRHLDKLSAEKATGFSVAERAYRYGDHGIYLSTKEKRKRVFILLTDNNQYKRQIYIDLKPDERNLVIHVPVETAVRRHEDYHARIGLAPGMRHMFVTDKGHVYGERYGEYQFALAEYVRKGRSVYQKNRRNNTGRKKYYAGKARLEAALHSYINGEINRLLETEMPEEIFLPKLPQNTRAGVYKVYNNAAHMWQRGYIKKRLTQKCQENSIRLVEVFAKNIGKECSVCGATGKKEKEFFVCQACGAQLPERENVARNALLRGSAQRVSVSANVTDTEIKIE